MVVRIRFSRIGIGKQPFYHVVIANAQSRRDGMPLEYVGKYHTKPNDGGKIKVQLDFHRIKYWLAVGAQPSDTIRILLGKVRC
jgi:small subunit ribosomal protein S16